MHLEITYFIIIQTSISTICSFKIHLNSILPKYDYLVFIIFGGGSPLSRSRSRNTLGVLFK